MVHVNYKDKKKLSESQFLASMKNGHALTLR